MKIGRKSKNKDQMTNKLYDYLFWYNPYQKCWYAIPTDQHMSFFSGKTKKEAIPGVMVSQDINTLIQYVSNPQPIQFEE